MHRTLLIAALLLLALVPGTALAAAVPEDAEYSEHYIPSASAVPNDDDPKLHADVLRPKGASGKVPTVLTVSPYTNHATQNASDFNPSKKGPSDRFFDFAVRDAKLFSRGYAYVMVDLRGTGGSAGCNDWGGPGEQNDVKRAVEWVASQPWSNGKVALYGKSYDGWTGLMGLAQKPRGLAAVISQEPVVDGYRYLYMNRMRFSNSVVTGALFQVIDALPGTVNDTPEYHSQNVWANVVKPGCYAQNVADQNMEDPNTEFWKARNLIDKVKGVTTPTFFMQGFLESNTKPDAVFDLWNNLAGSEHRAWFGQWDHVRGNDKVGSKFAAGRDTFVSEVMRFLDEHLKGVASPVADPPVVVQSSDGRFRSEERWPPADSSLLTSPLKPGEYVDDGDNTGDGSGAGNGAWTVSQPLPYRAHFAGVPRLTVDVAATPRSNLVANVYDIGPDRKATLVSRGAYLLAGSGKIAFDLYGQDWVLEPGHRIGVLLSSANSEWWDLATPTGQTVEVRGGSIALPFLRYNRPPDLSGEAGPAPSGGLQSLSTVRSRAFPVPADAFTDGLASFALPPALVDRPRLAGAAPVATAPVAGTSMSVQATQVILPRSLRSSAARKRIRLRVRRLRGRRLLITGSAPRGTRLTLRVLRRGKRVATRRVVVRRSTFRVIVKLRRAGRHTVRATGRTGATGVSTRAPRSVAVR
jgi:predicted acyl esterase